MAMRRVELHHDVYGELAASRAWYEDRASHLGEEFIAEIDHAMEVVRRTPDAWPVGDETRGIRRYQVHRFPYAVIYRVQRHAIQVIAVMHLHRRPRYWHGRTEAGSSDTGP
jgi:hypothetical protein